MDGGTLPHHPKPDTGGRQGRAALPGKAPTDAGKATILAEFSQPGRFF
jgi:hypothetical protein